MLFWNLCTRLVIVGESHDRYPKREYTRNSAAYAHELAWHTAAGVQMAIPYVMALSTASFIYIAMADLFPTLHRYMGLRQSMLQLFLILASIGTFYIFHLRQGA